MREYDRRLFHEFLVYSDSTLYEDKIRAGKIMLVVMDWFDALGNAFMIKEYEDITKNFWEGAKAQAKENFSKLLRED